MLGQRRRRWANIKTILVQLSLLWHQVFIYVNQVRQLILLLYTHLMYTALLCTTSWVVTSYVLRLHICTLPWPSVMPIPLHCDFILITLYTFHVRHWWSVDVHPQQTGYVGPALAQCCFYSAGTRPALGRCILCAGLRSFAGSWRIPTLSSMSRESSSSSLIMSYPSQYSLLIK